MKIPFYKMDGAGNDFVVIDNRTLGVRLMPDQVAAMCHRRLGIGADGLMTLEADANGYDFEMRYYNSDGHLASMCGNGGRCIATLAHLLGLGNELRFRAFDGAHTARIVSWDDAARVGIVSLSMRSVARDAVRKVEEGWSIDTGSPHFVLRVDNLEQLDVATEGRRWRQRADLFPEGTNVDFVQDLSDGRLLVRTYERGVEDETWACGTGVTACAIVTGSKHLTTRGGDFMVAFDVKDKEYADVVLTGPVALDFTGEWTLNQ